jgi:hypothetical protein
MSNFGGPNSAFEKDFALRFQSLSKKLTKLETSLQKLLVSSINGAKASIGYWKAIEAEMNYIYAQMIAQFDTWSLQQIPKRYKNSLYTINQRIKRNKSILAIGKRTTTALWNSNASRQIVNALYKDAADSFASAALSGKRNIQRLLRQTQQALINEGLVDITVAVGFEMGDLRKAADALSGGLWSALDEAVQNKQFVQAGRYKYKPDYYAELVARTKFHDAHTQAALAQARNYETDLVQVSSHNTTTRICMPFEGKIFSVSGNDNRFPPLNDSPPYHPNCLHLIYPTFIEALEASKQLDSFSAFSKGDIEKPPAPAGFIPVGQRA